MAHLNGLTDHFWRFVGSGDALVGRRFAESRCKSIARSIFPSTRMRTSKRDPISAPVSINERIASFVSVSSYPSMGPPCSIMIGERDRVYLRSDRKWSIRVPRDRYRHIANPRSHPVCANSSDILLAQSQYYSNSEHSVYSNIIHLKSIINGLDEYEFLSRSPAN